MGEGFGEAGVVEIVAEPGADLLSTGGGPRGDFPGNLLQSVKVSGRIAVPPVVVRDQGFSALEQGAEFLGHGRRERKHGFRRITR